MLRNIIELETIIFTIGISPPDLREIEMEKEPPELLRLFTDTPRQLSIDIFKGKGKIPFILRGKVDKFKEWLGISCIRGSGGVV